MQPTDFPPSDQEPTIIEGKLPQPVYSHGDFYKPGFHPKEAKLPRLSIEELMGRTFLVAQDDGTRVRAQVIEKINNLDAQNHQNIKLLCKLADDKTQIIMDYQTICDLIEEQDQEELEGKHWTFKKILSHVGPIKPTDENYMGSQYNVKVLWEDNSITDEPLKIIAKDNPITVAIYAQENGLLSTPGWKHLRHIVKESTKAWTYAQSSTFKILKMCTYISIQSPSST